MAKPLPSPPDHFRRASRAYILAGAAVTALLVGGIGGWAATTDISGAVVANGTLVVDTNVKKVQHPTGGIVGKLLVRDGDHVEANQLLLALDDTQLRANLAIISGAIDELSARATREEAERDGSADLSFPPDLLKRAATDQIVARLVQGETNLFRIRAATRAGQKAQLQERSGQLDEEIRGALRQVAAKERERVLINQELTGVRELYSKNLIQLTRLTALERDSARLEGEHGALLASIAQARGKKAEIALQIIQVDQDMRAEVGRDLAEIRGKLSELREKKVAAEDSLKRVEIRAPQSGIVHQLAVHTVGGVINPAEPIMLIVPESERLLGDVKVQPSDIDQLRLGQRAIIRFAAFNQRTTPEFPARIKTISADTTVDQRTGLAYYTVRLAIPEEEIAKTAHLRLVPGMPLDAYIQTGDRTIMSYLVKPLAEQVHKAWRER
jgi:HlyD family secretion protein